MGTLVDTFLAARNLGRGGEATAIDVGPLELSLGQLHARGQNAHPDIVIEEVVFAAHLGRCGAPVEAVTEGAHIHAEDLYLCCAGLLGDETAVRTLWSEYRPRLAGYVRHVQAFPASVDEVEQQLWDAVLVGSAEKPPELRSYSGKGSLAGWLGVVAQHIALMLLRHEAAEERAVARVGVEMDLVVADPELAFVKQHLRDGFRRAISKALEALSDRERMIYRLHIVDGLTVQRIAKMYGVAQSTVSRRMASARKSIVAEAQRILREEMHVATEEYESLSRLLASQLDLSVSRLLGTPPNCV